MGGADPPVSAGAAAGVFLDVADCFAVPVEHGVIEFCDTVACIVNIVADECAAGAGFCAIGSGSMNEVSTKKHG